MFTTRQRHGRLWAAAAIVLLLASAAGAADKVFESGLTFWNPTGPNKKASWATIVKCLNATLANAQQLNLYTDACYDGGLIGPATDATSGLTMPYVIGTSTTAAKKSEDGWSNKDKNPPGRLKAGDGDYYYSYSAYLAKHLGDVPKPTVKQLHDRANADVNADPDLDQTAQYAKSGTANEGLKIDEGTMSSHALVFASDLSDLYTWPPRENFKAVRALAYTSEAFYMHNFTAQALPEGGALSGQGTLANFKTALNNLKAAINAHENEETATIILSGHGYRTSKNVCKKPDAVPGQPKQGKKVERTESPTPIDFDMDDEFWQDVAEDVLSDDPTLVLGDNPKIYVAASEMSILGFMQVAIGRPGGPFFPIGMFTGADFETAPASDAAYLEVPLDPILIQDLVSNFGGQPDLTLEFVLEPSDFFRIALLDDLVLDPNYFPTEYGVGLMTTVSLIGIACHPDVNDDGTVNVLDLIDLLLCFGAPADPGCEAADVNGDGTVNVLDLIDLLLAFGTSCP